MVRYIEKREVLDWENQRRCWWEKDSGFGRGVRWEKGDQSGGSEEARSLRWEKGEKG